MGFISRRIRLKDNLIAGVKRYLVLNLVFLLLLFLTRVYEYYYLKHTITMPQGGFDLEVSGFGHDILMLLNLAALFVIPFLLIHILSRRLADIVFFFLIIFWILIELGLIHFLGSTSLLLGADLFGYTFDEIIKIVSAAGGFSVLTLLPVAIGVMLIIGLLVLSKHFKPNFLLGVLFVIISFISLAFIEYTKPEARQYNSELSYNLVTNKAHHIFSAIYLLYFPVEPHEADLFGYFYTGLDTPGKSKIEYVNPEFPFLRKNDTPDILGKYFNVGSDKPNLVFIIVESLGRAYSGEGAYLQSFTPFLDSLESRSLYWENAISTAGRTFEALPSIFGSMPYGKSGFAELGANMPDGMTLISLLKERGYESHFFYGGDATFDNMKLFLNKQHIDYVTDENDFGSTYKKMPANSGNFTWGYGEKDIFKKGFEVLLRSSSKPRLDIYLTLAMHDPYRIPDQDYYNRKVYDRLSLFNFNETHKEEYAKYLPNYASVLYFDDALRSFFTEYKKRDDFKNTIFFITGDHRMSSPPISTQIDRFHVPIVIYSPMLKSPAKFS